MNIKKLLGFSVLSIILGLFLSGWGAPSVIENIDNSKYFEKGIARSEIASAIQRGASRKGWRTKKINNGLIEATITVRGKYFVHVDINYTGEGYKIDYKKTRNLKYNPADKTIHPSYNKWTRILSENINMELEYADMNSVDNGAPIASQKVAKEPKKETLKKGSNIDLEGKTIYIKSIVQYAPKSRVANNIKQECTLSTAIATDIVKSAAEQGLNIIIKDKIEANEFELQVQIEGAISTGNAAIGHNKSVSISGAIVKNGIKYYSFDAARLSGGGYFGGYRSSCSVLGGISRRLGKDTAIWLTSPYDNAELGDTHLIRK